LPEGRIAAQSFLENEPQAYMRLQQVSDLIFGYETPYGMELLATVHWVGTKEVNPARDSDTPEESLCDRYYIVDWLSSKEANELPAPIRATMLTHRFLSIHPFNDGNGRTGRLLATAELWRSGYRMRGFFSFDEYFNADRSRYYRNLQMGLPVDFYEGRHDPDHTPWLLYFVETMARAACELQAKAKSLYETASPETVPWERLPRTSQQLMTRLLARVLDGVEAPFVINPSDIEFWFGISDRTSREWLKQWTEDDFIVPIKTASGARIRSYELAQEWIETCFKIRTSISENNGS
jgi:Fic/DOC family